ncbi:MAG: hypothetical protein QOH64_217 [Acidimicrobiaceae bacterium]
MSTALAGRRVVVIGASSGIGRGVAIAAAQQGADVIVAARRTDRLEEVTIEAPSAAPLVLDLRDAASCDRFSAAVRERFEVIDVLFISAGAAPLRRFAETTPTDWLRALETNVIGVHAAISRLVDLLRPGSLTMVVSSESVGEPRSHLGAYGASKAALEHSMSQWREEHPWLRFSVVSLGATVPTEFGSQFDGEDLLDALQAWAGSGRNQAAFMSTPEVCDVLAATIGALITAPSIDMPSIVLRSPSPRERDAEATIETATAAKR